MKIIMHNTNLMLTVILVSNPSTILTRVLLTCFVCHTFPVLHFHIVALYNCRFLLTMLFEFVGYSHYMQIFAYFNEKCGQL